VWTGFSGYELVVDSCEQGNEPLDCKAENLLNSQITFHLMKQGIVPKSDEVS
jgi:hypothetical protein